MAEGKYLYPATLETIHKYAASVFTPIRRGECVSTVWVPMAGRRMWNKFLIEHINLFKKELPNHQKYILVYIEPLDLAEESLTGYLRLIGKSFLLECQKKADCAQKINFEALTGIFEDETASYSKLLDSLKLCFKNAVGNGFEIVLFLGEFDELPFANNLFYNNLKSLWEGLRPKLHYVFLSVSDMSTPEMTAKMGELNAATLQNIIYISLLGDTDIEYFIESFGDQYHYKFSEAEKRLIRRLCGGHPYLIKSVTRLVSQIDSNKKSDDELLKMILNHFEPASVARKIFELRSTKEKEILNDLAAGKPVTLSNGTFVLEKLGLIRKTSDGRYGFFGELFALAIKEKPDQVRKETLPATNEGLSLESTTGTISYNGTPIEEKFTRQEYLVLKMFLEKPAHLFSRDNIGDVLWGKQAYDKYSDWAIDQLISKLRKKLAQFGYKDYLVTIKGRGYKLTKA